MNSVGKLNIRLDMNLQRRCPGALRLMKRLANQTLAFHYVYWPQQCYSVDKLTALTTGNR